MFSRLFAGAGVDNGFRKYITGRRSYLLTRHRFKASCGVRGGYLLPSPASNRIPCSAELLDSYIGISSAAGDSAVRAGGIAEPVDINQ